jgi:hypothetical protein
MGVGRPHLLFHHRELGRLTGFIERSRRDQVPPFVVAELAGDMDRVTNLDRLCVSVGIFPRHTEIGGLFTIHIHCGCVYVVALHIEPPGFSIWHRVSVAPLKVSV